jgi:hypothetical protein
MPPTSLPIRCRRSGSAGVWLSAASSPVAPTPAQGSDTDDLTRRLRQSELDGWGQRLAWPRAPNVTIQLDSMLDLIDVGVECLGVKPESTDR